jgi:hypothetical protein
VSPRVDVIVSLPKRLVNSACFAPPKGFETPPKARGICPLVVVPASLVAFHVAPTSQLTAGRQRLSSELMSLSHASWV